MTPVELVECSLTRSFFVGRLTLALSLNWLLVIDCD